MGNDRFKMAFWFEMLFDEDPHNDNIHDLPPDNLNLVNVYDEVQNWLRRHSTKDKVAQELLDRYTADVPTGRTPGPLPKEDEEVRTVPSDDSTSPVWKPDLTDKYEQDRLYARVSHEIDVWWKRVRDANYEGWVVPMETIEGAVERTAHCKENAMHRYMPRGGDHDGHYDQEYDEHPEDCVHDEVDDRSTREDNGEEDEEEEEDDDDSYVEGPLRGLLTEIPNILDTKQIEALHMTVKACIVDSMGSGLTPAGENLQKTRCKMFLALDCGKNLLRELLVFIAVWEQTDQQFIFQITAQIIESFHHNALLPYAWNSLQILKDIVSPAQTVLLRLINYMFRARKDSPIYDDLRDYNRDAKLIHFLYNYFRCRVVPDCIALIFAQEQIRLNKNHPSDFPVDLWDMERAKDGLSQYLDFISVIAEIPEMRHLLVEWEAVYEMVELLRALEAGVARKSLDERPMPGPSRPPPQSGSQENAVPPAPVPQTPLLHDTPHKFPWAGIKIQILIILTSLVAPTNARRQGPGNPTVQKQFLDFQGIMPLLNCCVYDGNNEYLKERATLCIKFVMEGCEEAQKFVRELVPVKQAPQTQAAAQQAQLPATLAQMQAQAQAFAQKDWNPTPPAPSSSAGPTLPPLPPSFKSSPAAPPHPSFSNGTASASSSSSQSEAILPTLPLLPTPLPTRRAQRAAAALASGRPRSSSIIAKERENLALSASAEALKKENEALRENLALYRAKGKELSGMKELGAMVGSSRGRTIELTDTASKIAAANRQIEEMKKFYGRAGKEFDGKPGK
jgi:palmitoyltransferase